MSLRADIQDAIDEVAPPAPWLADKVVQSVIAGSRRITPRSKRSRARWMVPFRVTVSLVAAAMVVSLMAGLVVGGRLWRDLNSSPTNPHPINQTELKRLEALPLQLPVVAPDAECPNGPTTNTLNLSLPVAAPVMYGDGPVFGLPDSGLGEYLVETSWGRWQRAMFEVNPNVSGLILVRAKDLKTGRMIVFVRDPLELRDQVDSAIPARAVVGTDSILGATVQEYPEAVLDLSRPDPVYRDHKIWPAWTALLGYPKAGTGCIGFQLDGATFTETYVIAY